MAEYQSNTSPIEAARLIAEARRAVITTHAKPDGDAFGSVVALAAAMKARGALVQAVFVPPVPASFRYLKGYELAVIGADKPWLDDPDLLLVLDTGAWAQVAPLRKLIEPHIEHTLVIDHHLSGDMPAKWLHVDGQAAATCEMVCDVLDELCRITGIDYFTDATVREALFVGIASDTGWFRFSNARPHTHEWAARLISAGVDHAELYRLTEQQERPQKLALLVRALDSLQWVADQRAAIMVLRSADFEQTGALIEETERFVDIPQMAATLQVVVLIAQPALSALPAGAKQGPVPRVGLSFRSKPASPGGPAAINVAELASKFGGGGHARAAGAKVAAPLDELIARVIEAVTAAFNAKP